MSSVRNEVLARNIFVELPEDRLTDQLLLNYLEKSPKNFAPISKLCSALSEVVLREQDDWDDIKPDYDLLEAGDETEQRRVMIAVSKRKFQMQTALKEEVAFARNNGHTEVVFNGDEIETRTDSLTRFMETLKVVQVLIWEWVNEHAETEGGVLAIGADPSVVDRKKFGIFSYPENGDRVSIQDLEGASWTILWQLAKEAKHKIRLQEEQRGIEVTRDEFEWSGNPLIAEFRELARPIINEHLQDYRQLGITEFDLATQVMMHLSLYEPTRVWLGDENVIRQVVELLSLEQGSRANELFLASLSSGEIWLNEELAHAECERQVLRLADHYQNLTVEMNGKEIQLPAIYMGDPEQNPFRDYPRTEINAKNRTYETDPLTGEKVMVVVEKYSGKRIIFKSVPPEISYLYSVGFCNLHYPRKGETAVYGAYLEGDELPFAYSSYSPVTRGYSRDMLSHVDVSPDNVMESARAWNSAWAPENTMSVLFAYAHDMMREKREAEIAAGDATEPLEGVFTSINPNLGFKAVSFRGVRFNVTGMKPTGFSYLRNEDGSADFMPKGEIMRILGVHSEDELENHPDFCTSAMPLLPTLEMLTLFDIEQEKELLEKPIYRVTQEAYNRN